MTKTCRRCQVEQSTAEFRRSARSRDGLQSWCKSCHREYSRIPEQRAKRNTYRNRWRRDNRKEMYNRDYRLKFRYGITEADFDRLLAKQGGRCALCPRTVPGGRWNAWHVDHDHHHCPGRRGCGECVRGLLCNWCNVGIGMLGDDAHRIRAAASYVERGRR